MLLYLHTMIFSKTSYIFTEIKIVTFDVSFYILSSSSSLELTHCPLRLFCLCLPAPPTGWPSLWTTNKSLSGEPCLLGCCFTLSQQPGSAIAPKRKKEKRKKRERHHPFMLPHLPASKVSSW